MIYSETTNKIEVSVRPVFLKDQSDPKDDYYVWAYEVDICNHGQETVQLMNRHWIIQNAFGQIEEVHGPGVIGQRPVLLAGESFQYSSFTMLATPTGNMRGFYEMETEMGKSFEIQIPTFKLFYPARLVENTARHAQLH